ncbi:hypothetical protein, partial [Mesorhizobium sp.]|uniref:hypothetical protein n=3 Tax=Mesorhizobium TaxID=68287 RepID=UPI0025D966DF
CALRSSGSARPSSDKKSPEHVSRKFRRFREKSWSALQNCRQYRIFVIAPEKFGDWIGDADALIRANSRLF